MGCSIKEVVEHVLQNPTHYPGPFHAIQPRTTRSLPQLDTRRQMLLIWDAMSTQIRATMQQRNSVVLRKFGTFTFETQLPEVENKHGVRKTTSRLVPCFMPHEILRGALMRYNNKDKIRRNTHSSFQQGPLKTIFLNEAPLAAGCYFTSDLVKKTLEALFTGIVDLAKRSVTLCLDFGVAKIRIANQDLQAVSMDPRLSVTLHDVKEEKLKRPPSRLSDTWRSPSFPNVMMSFIERPSSAERVAKRELCRNISAMSLDFNSCVRVR